VQLSAVIISRVTVKCFPVDVSVLVLLPGNARSDHDILAVNSGRAVAGKTPAIFRYYCFISLTKFCSAASFTRVPHYSTLNFTYVEDKQLFHTTAKN